MKIYNVLIRYDHNAYWDEDLSSVSEIQLECYETLHQAEQRLKFHYEKYLKAVKDRNEFKITFYNYRESKENNKDKELGGFRIDFVLNFNKDEEKKANICGIIIARDLIFDIPDAKKRRKLTDII